MLLILVAGGYTGNDYIRVGGRRIIWRVLFIQVGNITGNVILCVCEI